MKRFRVVAAALIIFGIVAATGAAPKEDLSWIMPSSQLREGMKGYGLTVFEGTKPERFKAEVIGVLHGGIGARVDMVVARLDHPRLKDIGVIAGMSGSPVFIDGRLIGAVAYGFSYSKVAIAGITPIEKMLEVYKQTPLQPPPRDIALGPIEEIRFGQPVSLVPKFKTFGQEPIRVSTKDLSASVRGMFDTGVDEIRLEPLAMPLMVSACSQQTAKMIEKIFRPLGMEPIFAPVGSSAAALDTPTSFSVEDGTAMGIPYMLGDLSMGVTGTVTHIRNGKLVAFGHPMSARGPVVFPMGIARILTTVPSRMRPFKLGEIVNVIGSIHEDRLPAVGGIVGKIPYMVPMTVRVKNEVHKTDRTFRFKLMDHRLYAPRMALVAMVESCTAGDRSEGEMTASAHYTIETDDGRTIEKESMASGTGAAQSLATQMLNDVAPIYSNSFEVRSVRKIEAEVRIRDKIEAATLRSAFVDRSIYKPGQTVHVSVYIKPWRQPQRRLTTTLRIPPDTKDGRYNLVVCDSTTRRGAEIVRAPGKYRPRSFADIIRLASVQYMPDRLYVMLNSSERGVTIQGEEFNTLPPTIARTLGILKDREPIVPTIGAILAEKSVKLPFVMQGSDLSRIQVDRHGGR